MTRWVQTQTTNTVEVGDNVFGVFEELHSYVIVLPKTTGTRAAAL